MEVTQLGATSRILYIITKANWGGAQRYVYDMALAARHAGYEVTVAYGGGGRLADRLNDAGIDTITLSTLGRDINAGQDIATFRELLKTIRHLQPSVVHSNSSKAGLLAAIAARIAGVPHSIFTAHGWAFNENRPRAQKVALWLLHYVTVLFSDTTICVSDAARRDTRFMPFVQKKLTVIHNGVDAVSFLSKDEARKRLLPNTTSLTWIGSIAELHPTKQLDVAIKAFAHIATDFPQAILVLMGEGQERGHLTALIAHLKIIDRVYLCGHIDNASHYLPALDIFVLPSRSEGLAYAILEAGSAKLPVIASNVGGIPEIIESEKYGLLTSSGDVTAVAAAFRELLSEDARRVELGSALKARVEQAFSTKKMVDRTLAQYLR